MYYASLNECLVSVPLGRVVASHGRSLQTHTCTHTEADTIDLAYFYGLHSQATEKLTSIAEHWEEKLTSLENSEEEVSEDGEHFTFMKLSAIVFLTHVQCLNSQACVLIFSNLNGEIMIAYKLILAIYAPGMIQNSFKH